MQRRAVVVVARVGRRVSARGSAFTACVASRVSGDGAGGGRAPDGGDGGDEAFVGTGIPAGASRTVSVFSSTEAGASDAPSAPSAADPAGASFPHISSYRACARLIAAFASASPARKDSLSGSTARPARYAFTASPPCPRPVSAAPLRPYPLPHFGDMRTHRSASASASSYLPSPACAADRFENSTWFVLSMRIAIVNCFTAFANSPAANAALPLRFASADIAASFAAFEASSSLLSDSASPGAPPAKDGGSGVGASGS